MAVNQVWITNPATNETHHMSGWADKLGINLSTFYERYKKYKDSDIQKLFVPSRLSHGKAWIPDEDEFLIANLFAPFLYEKWNCHAKKNNWHSRSRAAIKSRILILQQRGEAPKKRRNSLEAYACGWMNITQLAEFLSVTTNCVEMFIANGLKSQRYGAEVKINTKDFVLWSTKPQGAALVSNAIRGNDMALNWLLVTAGNYYQR